MPKIKSFYLKKSRPKTSKNSSFIQNPKSTTVPNPKIQNSSKLQRSLSPQKEKTSPASHFLSWLLVWDFPCFNRYSQISKHSFSDFFAMRFQTWNFWSIPARSVSEPNRDGHRSDVPAGISNHDLDTFPSIVFKFNNFFVIGNQNWIGWKR